MVREALRIKVAVLLQLRHSIAIVAAKYFPLG